MEVTNFQPLVASRSGTDSDSLLSLKKEKALFLCESGIKANIKYVFIFFKLLSIQLLVAEWNNGYWHLEPWFIDKVQSC